MKTKELRIGNYVADEWGTVSIVDSISSKGINLYIDDDSNWAELSQQWIEARISIDEIRAIPTSDEWLLKFGLSRELDEPFNWSDKKKYLTDCFLLGHYSDGLHYVKNGVKIGKPLKYVHQIQNLFFSLNGTEINAN